MAPTEDPSNRAGGYAVRTDRLLAFAAGAVVGTLGGLVGLGGAEFRLPLLIGLFGFAVLAAIIMNKAVSLLVVATALPARLVAVPYAELAPELDVAANLLVGSLAGAWLGATWATRLRSTTLYKVLAGLLVVIAGALALSHAETIEPLNLGPVLLAVAGLVAGLAIGAVAALMGVAGGELLIPTIVLLYGVDIKTAGSLSLLVSLPTMLVAFARYSQDQSFAVLRRNRTFLAWIAAGSILGAVLGGLLLGVVPSTVLVPMLVLLLLWSAVRVWSQRTSAATAVTAQVERARTLSRSDTACRTCAPSVRALRTPAWEVHGERRAGAGLTPPVGRLSRPGPASARAAGPVPSCARRPARGAT